MKKRELALVLCLSSVLGGVALAYLPFVLPACPSILQINACPQFWLGKKVIVFGKLQAVVEQRFVVHPYNYVLHDPITGVQIGVRLDMAHLYIWPYIDEYDGAHVIINGIVRKGLLQSTFIVQTPEYYIEEIAITIIRTES